MSLRALTVAFLLAFLVATAATGIATYFVTTRAIVQLVDRRIETISDVVVAGDAATATPAAMLARIGFFTRQRDTGDIGFVLSDRAGRRIGGNVTLRRALPPGYSDLRSDDGLKGLFAGRAYVRPAGPAAVLTTIAELEPVDHYETIRARVFAGGFASIVLIVAAGCAAFAASVARRTADMRRTVDAIVEGDMRRRLPVRRGNDAFDRQAAAFNRMLDRIAELVAGLRNVSNDVAHDLRTPLVRLRTQLAALAARPEASALAAPIDAAMAQCDHLLAMFTALLRISEVEAGERVAAFETIDLGALVAEVAAMMEPVVADAGDRLTIGEVTAARVSGDRQLLTQALLNLIANASRHTPAGSAIRVEVAATGTAVTATVADDGPGIPADRYALALRRFGRLDASRSRPGHGLGLPLVAAIVRLHRGELRLADAGPGLAVSFTLPSAEG